MCDFEELPGYDVQYAKNKNLSWKLITQLPHIAANIKKEKKVIKQLHSKYQFDIVISDNRFGSNIEDIPSVYITHQVNIISPIGKGLLKKLHANIINEYNECWIPDYQGNLNLAGELSQNSDHLKKAFYIGKLSHLNIPDQEKEYDIAYLLSGPEPQRSILEQKVITEHPKHLKGVLVRGSNKNEALPKLSTIEVFDLLESKGLESILAKSSKVLCRTGYSSIMDLCQTNIPVLMIPTPGQTEQEYIGKILSEKFNNVVSQDDYAFKEVMFHPINIGLSNNFISFQERIQNLLK